QEGSLNPDLLTTGVSVKGSDFLGLAGNSGNASEPHLHIHAVKGTTPETGPLRPSVGERCADSGRDRCCSREDWGRNFWSLPGVPEVNPRAPAASSPVRPVLPPVRTSAFGNHLLFGMWKPFTPIGPRPGTRLPLVSTMRLAPRSSKWVSSDIC